MRVSLNTQPQEGRRINSPNVLEVVDVWPTIQGEGPFAGQRAVFVRLAGCNLQCPWCDTDYTTNRQEVTHEDLVGVIKKFGVVQNDLIVISGGEPFRQSTSLVVFVQRLLNEGFRVQIETNGSMAPLPMVDWGYLPVDKVMIVCSPKGSINKHMIPLIGAYKYVLTDGKVSAEDGLPDEVLGNNTTAISRPIFNRDHGRPKVPVYVQPMDEENPEANARHLRVTIESVMKFGYILCLQVHKICGMP